MWKLKRKDNRIDQNTLQCYYGYALYKGKKVGTIFMDLSEAFDTLNHNLLLAKLSAYGFCFSVIKLVQIYLLERFQRVNINNSFSEWCKILLGVPQESILGPFLCNILINDIFYFLQEAYICNFADDSSSYSIGNNFKEVKTILKKNSYKCGFMGITCS